MQLARVLRGGYGPLEAIRDRPSSVAEIDLIEAPTPGHLARPCTQTTASGAIA